MKLLKDRILKDGVVKPGNILKVDSFLNHQMILPSSMKSAKNSNAASPTVQSLKSLQLKHPVSVSPVLLHSTLMYL